MDPSSDHSPRRGPWIGTLVVFGATLAAVALAISFADVNNPTQTETAIDSMVPNDAAAFADLVEMSHGAMVDTEMPHLHMGSDAMPVELSPSDEEALAAQLALATIAGERYNTVEEATAAGYVQISPYVDGVGSHWTKWSLVDQPFDIETPSQLLFEEITWGEGPELVAFSYWVLSDETPDGFVGDRDQWHRHLGLCFENGQLTTENNADATTCNGDWINGDNIWMLHAWIVPGMENRFGVFHSVNPRLCERYCE